MQFCINFWYDSQAIADVNHRKKLHTERTLKQGKRLILSQGPARFQAHTALHTCVNQDLATQ